jgi:N-acetylglucosamine-6-phosphate deacetylase
MASTYPAEFLKAGERVGRIAQGQRADLVVVDESLEVRSSWIGGDEGKLP